MKTIAVTVGLLQRDGKVLLCQRKRGARYELKWEFPGGKVEPGETPEQAVARELSEELSINIRGAELIEKSRAGYSDGNTYDVSYFRVTSFAGEPRNNVFEQIRWVGLQELSEFDILEGNKSFVDALVRASTLKAAASHPSLEKSRRGLNPNPD